MDQQKSNSSPEDPLPATVDPSSPQTSSGGQAVRRAFHVWEDEPANALNSPVKTAAMKNPLRPIDDPFGDKQANPDARKSIPPPQPLPAAAGDMIPPPETPSLETAAPQDEVPANEEDVRSAPPNNDGSDSPHLLPSPANASQAPPFPAAEQDDSVEEDVAQDEPSSSDHRRCGPKQNDGRDCCANGRQCARHRRQLLGGSLRDISVDISPPFAVTGRHVISGDNGETDEEANRAPRTLAEVRQRRDEKLLKSPSRTWQGRNGKILAQGRMVDLVNSKVVVADPSGHVTAHLPLSALSEEDLCFVNSWWDLPLECDIVDKEVLVARHWTPSTFTWRASALCHKSLYFEQVQLERYGHTTGPILQPVISGAHFFANIALLPYQMGIHPVHECRYALGYYRPGNCAPWLVPPFPLSLRGALLEGAAVTGLVFFIP